MSLWSAAIVSQFRVEARTADPTRGSTSPSNLCKRNKVARLIREVIGKLTKFKLRILTRKPVPSCLAAGPASSIIHLHGPSLLSIDVFCSILIRYTELGETQVVAALSSFQVSEPVRKAMGFGTND
jgi:hypothetical protein